MRRSNVVTYYVLYSTAHQRKTAVVEVVVIVYFVINYVKAHINDKKN